MPFREALKKEVDVIVHGQTAKFRIIKYIVLLLLGYMLYVWQGLRTTVWVFLALAVISIIIHLLFRRKTRGWTESWWLYKNDRR